MKSTIFSRMTWKCPLCEMPAAFESDDSRFLVTCCRCGEFRITSAAANDFSRWALNSEQRANISGYIRENPRTLISWNKPADLKNLRTPSVAQKAEKLLRAISKMYPAIGQTFKVPEKFDTTVQALLTTELKPYWDTLFFEEENAAEELEIALKFLSFGWVKDEKELHYLIFDYLRDGAGFLVGETETISLCGPSIRPARVRNAPWAKISPQGWEHLQSVGRSEGQTGFVAMWFDAQMDSIWESALKPAIEAAGYRPLRIDKEEHNNKIDDEIIASIRGAQFVVADFTGDRGGVYYEAGFAGGLGKPVIWTVEDAWAEEVHFDTRQFNHIRWNRNQLPEFSKRLQLRIEATLGKGPYPVVEAPPVSP